MKCVVGYAYIIIIIITFVYVYYMYNSNLVRLFNRKSSRTSDRYTIKQNMAYVLGQSFSAYHCNLLSNPKCRGTYSESRKYSYFFLLEAKDNVRVKMKFYVKTQAILTEFPMKQAKPVKLELLRKYAMADYDFTNVEVLKNSYKYKGRKVDCKKVNIVN